MTDVQTHYWDSSDNIRLAWREVGEGRPVILMHGLFSDAHMNWIKFGHAERIAAEGFRVIMPDLRAHGLSGKPHEQVHYPQLVLVRDLKELIEELALDDFDLGGFSLGARTTIEAIIGGLKPRAPVKSAGVVVGRVEDIKFDDKSYLAVVTLNLESRYKFPKDTSAKILTSGLLGLRLAHWFIVMVKKAI